MRQAPALTASRQRGIGPHCWRKLTATRTPPAAGPHQLTLDDT
ncbi:hypothetical protein AB0I84_06070 [Streptomyces spectabilis]